MAVTGGVHTVYGVLKSHDGRRKGRHVTSCLLQYGIEYVGQSFRRPQGWMEEHEYESIQQMQGSHERPARPQTRRHLSAPTT